MAKVSPWYSPKEDVHHNNILCVEGMYKMNPHDRYEGTGDKPLCSYCKMASSEGR